MDHTKRQFAEFEAEARLKREELYRKTEELERSKIDNMKLKNIIDDQMVIAEK